jgi:hypothetical protein
MPVMNILDRDTHLFVVYKSPIVHRLFVALKVGFSALILMLVVAALYWGALVQSVLNGHVPGWVHVFGIALVLSTPVFILWLAHRSEPTRLVLHENRLRVGGWLFGREIPFDDVGLVTLEEPEATVGKAQHLIIQRRSGKATKIWLKPADAAECFNALRALCEHIPALGPGHEVYAPANPEHDHQARRVLAMEFRRKARRAVATMLVCGALAIAAGAGLILGGSAARTRPKVWIAVVILPAMAIGSAIASSKYRRAALVLERDEEELATQADLDAA